MPGAINRIQGRSALKQCRQDVNAPVYDDPCEGRVAIPRSRIDVGAKSEEELDHSSVADIVQRRITL